MDTHRARILVLLVPMPLDELDVLLEDSVKALPPPQLAQPIDNIPDILLRLGDDFRRQMFFLGGRLLLMQFLQFSLLPFLVLDYAVQMIPERPIPVRPNTLILFLAVGGVYQLKVNCSFPLSL